MSLMGNLEHIKDNEIKNPEVPKPTEIPYNPDLKIDAEGCARIPRTKGEWSENPGDSTWNPDKQEIPGDRNGTNPEGKTWGEILADKGIDGIPFKDNQPDFSEIAKGEVEIDDFSDNRIDNFNQADEKMAEQRGCTPEEVDQWRQEHRYTWHECPDCKTMQKVPTEVHGNIPHSGGISVYKQLEKTEEE